MADREELVDIELMDRIAAIRVSVVSSVRRPRRRSKIQFVRSRRFRARDGRFRLLRNHARRPHHIQHAGNEAEQKEHDEPPGRSRQQAIETPSKSRSDKNASDQFRREANPRAMAEAWLLPSPPSRSGLVRLDFAAVADVGQALIQTSEPCGKRSFVRRFIATSIFPFVRAFRHDVETRHDAVEMEIAPRRP